MNNHRRLHAGAAVMSGVPLFKEYEPVESCQTRRGDYHIVSGSVQGDQAVTHAILLMLTFHV